MCKKTFRYSNSSAVSSALKVLDFLGTLVMNYNGIMGWAALCSAVRIVRVDIYDLSGSTDVANSTIKWCWKTNQGRDNFLIASGTPIYPGSLSLVPPRESLASQWMSNQTYALGNSEVARCVLPINCYLDLTMELVLQDAQSQGVLQSGAAGSTGQIGLKRLDSSASGFLVAISMFDAA